MVSGAQKPATSVTLRAEDGIKTLVLTGQVHAAQPARLEARICGTVTLILSQKLVPATTFVVTIGLTWWGEHP
jgi:hypothetical protein